MNPLVGNQPEQQATPNISEMYQNFKRNPIEFLAKSKLNIPQNVGNNPQDIIQYLMNSGQVSQQQIIQAQNMLPQIQKMFR